MKREGNLQAQPDSSGLFLHVDESGRLARQTYARVVTLVGQRRGPVGEGLEGGAVRLTDECFHQSLDVLHAVLHGRKQHPPQEAGVEQRPGPAHTQHNELINVTVPEASVRGDVP